MKGFPTFALLAFQTPYPKFCAQCVGLVFLGLFCSARCFLSNVPHADQTTIPFRIPACQSALCGPPQPPPFPKLAPDPHVGHGSTFGRPPRRNLALNPIGGIM